MTEETSMKLGEHYKIPGGEQHHERVTRLGLNWYQANITKYAERCLLKGTCLMDLYKVIDYATMMIHQIESGAIPEDPKGPSPSEEGMPTSAYIDQDGPRRYAIRRSNVGGIVPEPEEHKRSS